MAEPPRKMVAGTKRPGHGRRSLSRAAVERLTATEAASRAGVSVDDAIRMWRICGFRDPPPQAKVNFRKPTDLLAKNARPLPAPKTARKTLKPIQTVSTPSPLNGPSSVAEPVRGNPSVETALRTQRFGQDGLRRVEERARVRVLLLLLPSTTVSAFILLRVLLSMIPLE